MACRDNEHNYMPIGEPVEFRVGHWSDGNRETLQKVYCTKCGVSIDVNISHKVKAEAKEV